MFWDGLDPTDPKMYNHPILAKAYYNRRAVPISVWGDAGKFSNKSSLYLISMSFLLGEGDAWYTNLLLAAIPKACT